MFSVYHFELIEYLFSLSSTHNPSHLAKSRCAACRSSGKVQENGFSAGGAGGAGGGSEWYPNGWDIDAGNRSIP